MHCCRFTNECGTSTVNYFNTPTWFACDRCCVTCAGISFTGQPSFVSFVRVACVMSVDHSCINSFFCDRPAINAMIVSRSMSRSAVEEVGFCGIEGGQSLECWVSPPQYQARFVFPYRYGRSRASHSTMPHRYLSSGTTSSKSGVSSPALCVLFSSVQLGTWNVDLLANPSVRAHRTTLAASWAIALRGRECADDEQHLMSAFQHVFSFQCAV